MSEARRTAIHLFLMVAVGILLGLVAPFGSAALPAGQRLFFWVLFILAGYAIFRPVAVIASWLTAETRVPRPVAVVLTALVGSLPLAAMVGFALGGMRVTDFWFGDRFAILYVQVVAVGLLIHLGMNILFPERRETSASAPAGPDAASPTEYVFFRRLPPGLGTDLLCLEMQDHYLRVQTAAGSALLLLRMRDAIAELDGLGIQVHRGWWVAYRAIARLDQDGRSLRLVLTDGTVVPVSRANTDAVRALADRGFDRPMPAGKSPDAAAASPRAA